MMNRILARVQQAHLFVNLFIFIKQLQHCGKTPQHLYLLKINNDCRQSMWLGGSMWPVITKQKSDFEEISFTVLLDFLFIYLDHLWTLVLISISCCNEKISTSKLHSTHISAIQELWMTSADPHLIYRKSLNKKQITKEKCKCFPNAGTLRQEFLPFWT